jgi:SAM-dependent methyltransferase
MHPMDNQDFEAYADFKRFNANVADTWVAAFCEAQQRLGKSPHKIRLLDYGCGDGKYFAHLTGIAGLLPEHVHGLEVSARRVQRCHELGWTQTQLQDIGSSRLPYDDGSFDLVNMMEVIEHVPRARIDVLLRELRRVLSPGGFLLVSSPNYPVKRFYDFSDALLHRKWSRLRDDPTHVSPYTHQSLQSLLFAHFASAEVRSFKDGYLYRRLQHPALRHKLFFLCQA